MFAPDGKSYLQTLTTFRVVFHVVKSDGTDLTGAADLRFDVQRMSDLKVRDWDGAGSWQTIGAETTLYQGLTEVDATRFPGWYSYTWDLTTVTHIADADEWLFKLSKSGASDVGIFVSGVARIVPADLTGAAYEGALIAKVADSVWDEAIADHKAGGSIGRTLLLIRGVLFGNYTYNVATVDSVYGIPTSWVVTVYDTSGDVPADEATYDAGGGGTTLGTFTVAAEQNGNFPRLTTFLRAVLAET